MTLTKADIIEHIAKMGFSKRESIHLVETLIEKIKATLESGEDILISGFGKFCVKNKKARRGRNPQTGEDIILDQRRIVTFNCSTILRDRINGEKS